MSTADYSTAQLRKLTKEVIEFKTSYMVEEILDVDKKNGIVKVKCLTTFNNFVNLQVVFRDGKVRVDAPGMGTLLVKKV